MHDRLRQQWRDRVGKAPEPTAAIIDAQSTRSTAQGGNSGFDVGKKVKGRKRHLVVDTLGLLLALTVTSASVQDRDGADAVVAQACAKVPGLHKLYADAAYGGQCAARIAKTHDIAVEVVRQPPIASLVPLPTRRSSRCGWMRLRLDSSSKPNAGSSSARTPGTSGPDA